jgi:DNA-directed RNA polymerase subunit D
MELINKKEEKITFKAEIEETLANAVRRYLNRVPVLAVEEIEISKNDSPLYDETIAHRIGLIPLKTAKTVTEKSTNELKLAVKKEGIVSSEELKGTVKPVYEKLPITILKKGQELELVAKIKAGRGSEHSKFSPGLMFYRNSSEITMEKEFYNEIKNIFPEIEIKEKGDKIIIFDDQEKNVCDVCEGIGEKASKKAETKIGKELVITLESFGQMNSEDILKKSVEELKKDLNEVSKKIK